MKIKYYENNSIFTDKIFLLSGNKINLKFYNPLINITKKYHPLFEGRYKNFNVSLNEVANLVDNILSRKEEYGNIKLDKLGRFNHNDSFLVQNKLDQSPIIDELILEILSQLNLKVRSIWPGGKKAAVCLTHDVDSIDGLSYFWMRKINWYWQWFRGRLSGNWQEADKWMLTLKKWLQFRKLNFDPMDSFDKIRELEDNYGFRSVFFFMSLRHGLSREGRRYAVQNPRVAQILRELLSNGWEIGLHAAYYNHLSESSLMEQKQRLEDVIQEKILGCRHHFLRVRFPESWKLYAQAGFKYSSNMGWGSGFNGFRAGTCIPFKPLEREYSLWEIPFQLMDRCQIADSEDYMNTFFRYLKCIKAVGGCLVIDFHQEYLHEEVAPGVGKVYQKILDAIANDSAVTVLTLSEVCKIMEQAEN